MPIQKSMLQLRGMQPYSPRLKKDIMELEKIQKKVGNCFHMRNDCESWESSSLEKIWLETECGRGL